MRRLALRAERLGDLTPAELEAVAGGITMTCNCILTLLLRRVTEEAAAATEQATTLLPTSHCE